ncbi:MAG: hypothetical protein RBT74_07355 [Tenuifilaceae bacterium]|jgi:hypothetical protein|nr:hypothetical protein [Tenuifilaceae bacterium]
MVRCFLCLPIVILLLGCSGEKPQGTPPHIEFQAGSFTQDGNEVPLGGKLSFGIVANGGGEPLTNIRVQRITPTQVITESDLGLFIPDQDYHYTLNAVKSNAPQEIWRFMAMNANRDSSILTLTVNLGEGTAYGPIRHYESIKIGMQDNTEFPHFLDVRTGNTYTAETVTGNEAAVDILAFVYYTGGKWSPTLNCPQYTTAPSYYPVVSNWTTRNSTVYDYNATDNDLVQLDEFLAASNDSLLVSSFKPGTSSGNCKFCYTGKLVPFKTQQGEYGIIRVKHADTTTDGYMELEIKVQE